MFWAIVVEWPSESSNYYIPHYTPQTWKLVLQWYHIYSYTYLLELQVGRNFFQAPYPPYRSTSLTCISTRYDSHAPSKSSNYTLQTWKLVLWRYHTYSYIYLLELQVGRNFFQAPSDPPYRSTSSTCASTRYSHTPSESSNYGSLHPPNMETSISTLP
jgi:hypothetical protein